MLRKLRRKLRYSRFAENSRLSQLINNKYFGINLAIVYFIVMIFIGFTFHKVEDILVAADFFSDYVPHAKQFLNGQGYVDWYRGPAYPIFLGLSKILIGDFFRAGIFLSTLSAAIVIVFWNKIFTKLFVPAVGNFLTILLCISPIFVLCTYTVGTDMLFLALLSIGIYIFIQVANKFNLVQIGMLGILIGLIFLTRFNGIVFLASTIFAIVFITHRQVKFRERLAMITVLSFYFFLAILPYGLYTFATYGEFIPNRSYTTTAFEVYEKDRMDLAQYYDSGETDKYTSFADVFSRDPQRFITKIASNFIDNFYVDSRVLGFLFAALILLGAGVVANKMLERKAKPALIFYLLLVGLIYATLTLTYYVPRYSLALMPAYIILIYYSIKYLSDKLSPKRRATQKLSAIIFIAPLIILAMLFQSWRYNSELINTGPQYMLTIADWAKSNIPDRAAKLMTRSKYAPYYLGLDNYIALPFVNSLEELLASIKNDPEIKYLFVSELEAYASTSFLESLRDPQTDIAGLQPIYHDAEHRLVLYGVNHNP